MQKITPHLWFDKEAKEASQFYVAAFGGNSRVKHANTLHNTPSGSVDIISFELWGYEFMAISAGPLFKFNPSVSFHVKCGTKDEVDVMWAKLSPGGTALIELGSYPFSERYGWLQDKYGLSWQIIYAAKDESAQRITPALMFTGNACGRTEEAVNFYTSVFHDAKVASIFRYGKGEEPDKERTVKYAHFILEGQAFGAMDSAREHNFHFNEAISMIVNCNTQDEIDYYWNKLSDDPKSEQCGWLKDKFGFSWQVTPVAMNEMLASNDEKKIARVTEAFLKMKKFDLAQLQRAFEGR
ncbi:MAG TPA: VOC family protein [Chitinophagales bacterium]|nr:VOC family protein [Chitinophagales bacterium]